YHCAERILRVQEVLKEPLVIENISSYLTFPFSTLSEAEFLTELVRQTDCYLLLDVNNLFVNSVNQKFSAIDYLDGLPKEAIKELHLGGFETQATYLIDTHGQPVHPKVWQLYKTV